MREFFPKAFSVLSPVTQILIATVLMGFALQQTTLFGESVGKALFRLTH